MPVEIKPLKGFDNPLNNESNTLSLPVKSDYGLNEHLNKSKQKLLISLTSIINHFKDAHKISFYHKIDIPSSSYKWNFKITRLYEISLNSLKIDIDDSLKEVIKLCPNKFNSHFVNIIVKKTMKC